MIEAFLVSQLVCGVATYYGHEFHGNITANGEQFNAYSLTAAHPYYKFGTRLLVTNQHNGKQVVVRINDRGPYSGASIDLSYQAFKNIASTSQGRSSVCYRKIA